MEKKMETAIGYWDNIRIMEKKMETTIGHLGLYGPVRHKHCRGRWSRGCDLLRVLCMDLRWHVPCMAICDLSRKVFCPPSRNYNKSSTWRCEKIGSLLGVSIRRLSRSEGRAQQDPEGLIRCHFFQTAGIRF